MILLKPRKPARIMPWLAAPILVLVVLVGPLSAVAVADDGITDRNSTSTATPMRIVGFDREVAVAHGYKIVSRNGREVAVRINAPQAAVQSYDTVYGDCGSSYLYMSGGNNTYYMRTGFNLDTRAVDFYWHVDFDGPYGYDRDWYSGYPLGLKYGWSSGTRSTYVDDTGWYAGEVQSGFAILWNGGVCYALHPDDRARVH